jgi:alpha,alpha-trehalase
MHSRPFRLEFLLLCAVTMAGAALAQTPPAPSIPIDTYINQSWDSLTRSTSDCASLADPKLTSAPVLYLPAEIKVSAALKALQLKCKVEVRNLPTRIKHLGDLSPAQIPAPGLLYLPNPYVVPGGRFNEMYGWDSYFILLGELADNRIDLARDLVDNFFYELEHYGAILNANRTYYLTRSQPPFLSSMVLELYRAELPTDPKEARALLRHALPFLVRDYASWVSAPHLAGSTGLSRYSDLGHGPVPELADDSTYYIDIIHWLLAHPDQTPPGYLHKLLPTEASTLSARTQPLPQSQRGKEAAWDCGQHCPATTAEGFALTDDFLSGDRAMRESGFDITFRFGPFGGSTQDLAPVGLNALLFKFEHDLAFITATLGDTEAAVAWSEAAGERRERIDSLLWNESAGLYFDYDFANAKPSTYRYLTAYYALWSGVASPAQAQRLAANLPLFEQPGGLAMSTPLSSGLASGMQWDYPFGWAPTNWLAVAGLNRYGFTTDAQRIAREFTSAVASNYARDGTIREKYNVVSPQAGVTAAAGYKSNVIGFGWTNAVYLKMQQLLAAQK